MQVDEFKSILATFSDPGSELLVDRAKAVFAVNGETIEVTISARSGEIQVQEDDAPPVPANHWIIKRLAKLPLLAARLIEQIPEVKNFISPAAKILPSLDLKPDGIAEESLDARRSLLQAIDDTSPLQTSVVYITSDAGEGKTSLISAAAREQASKFAAGAAKSLLVPIVLGGRHFLRFDDITVGALQNRYRFPFLYFDSFLALVRMGVIVPAFDGFEEMFVENSSGEALSAMGILVNALKSTGTVVVAARKAYFEFENLRSQERLYDSIRSQFVSFSKIELRRWNKHQFFAYCSARGISNANTIYEQIRLRLGENHSLLTRPVLVRRLVDIAEGSTSLEVLLEKIQSSGADFFSTFVRGIIDREATEKWLDRSGEAAVALLTTNEHCELLSMIAIEMWEARVDFIKLEHLDLVTDFFCDYSRKSPLQARQIRERIRGHALLVVSTDNPQSVEFDHDEFRQFFLGEGLARLTSPTNPNAKSEVLSVLRRAVLPEHAQISFLRAIKRHEPAGLMQILMTILAVSKLDGSASYTHENCSRLLVLLLSGTDIRDLTVDSLVFGVDALRDVRLPNVEFTRCYFAQGSLESADLSNCAFFGCQFGQMRIFHSTRLAGAKFVDCIFESIKDEQTALELWEPATVRRRLQDWGANIQSSNQLQATAEVSEHPAEQELVQLEKVLRYFMRSTHISESIIKIRLGDGGQRFLDDVLPTLLECGVLEEIDNRGGNTQRRFKLGMQLQTINSLLVQSQGELNRFTSLCVAQHQKNG